MTSMQDAPQATGCPRRGPGRPRSEEAERAILDAAVDLLARCGVSGLSMEAVAAHACVAKTTVYRRWSSKTELVLAALAQMKGPVAQPPGESVRDDLLYLVNYVVRSSPEAPEAQIFARLVAEADQHPEIGEQYWQRIIKPRREVMYQVLRRGIAEGLIRPDANLRLMGEMLIAPVVVGRLHENGYVRSEQEIEQLVDAVLTGWAPAAADRCAAPGP
jgi:AcrR family transcriptional regulator